MENEQVKQQFIESCWVELVGEKIFRNDIHHLLDAVGWVNSHYIHPNILVIHGTKLEIRKLLNKNFLFRPVALTNILTNNGWTRIESDGSNLPKVVKGEKFEVLLKSKIRTIYIPRDIMTAGQLENEFTDGYATHYKLYKEPTNPLY